MTDPKQLATQLDELAEGNLEKAEKTSVVEEEGYLNGAAAAYQDSAEHLREELVRMDTITVPVVDFSFFQAQMAHALERAIKRDDKESDEDLDVQSVKRAHEQMLSVLETHAERPTMTLELPDEDMLSKEDIREAMESMVGDIQQQNNEEE